MSWKDILRKGDAWEMSEMYGTSTPQDLGGAFFGEGYDEEPRTVLVYVTIHPVDEQVNNALREHIDEPHLGWNQDFLDERIEQTEEAYNEYKNKIQPKIDQEIREFKEDAYAALEDWGIGGLQPEIMDKLKETGVYYRIDAWGWGNDTIVIYDGKTDKFDKEAFIEGSFPQRGDHF